MITINDIRLAYAAWKAKGGKSASGVWRIKDEEAALLATEYDENTLRAAAVMRAAYNRMNAG